MDGGATEPCDDMGDGEFVCGWEIEGDFEITARAFGYSTEIASVTVGADECHVIPEKVGLTLTALDCDQVVVPAVWVDVVDDLGAPVTNATVTWGLAEADMDPVACEPVVDNRYACADDTPGDLEIRVEHRSFQPHVEEVSVDHDGCHPLTETIEVALAP